MECAGALGAVGQELEERPSKMYAAQRQSYLVSSHAQHALLGIGERSELGRHGLRRHAGFAWVQAGQGPMAGHALYLNGTHGEVGPGACG